MNIGIDLDSHSYNECIWTLMLDENDRIIGCIMLNKNCRHCMLPFDVWHVVCCCICVHVFAIIEL